MDEIDEFEPRESFRDGEPDRGDVLVKEEAGRLRIELVVTRWGVPRRQRRPPAVWLNPGEWARWQVNYRFSSRLSDWSYRLDTLNLAYGQARIDVFSGSPTRFVDERTSLR